MIVFKVYVFQSSHNTSWLHLREKSHGNYPHMAVVFLCYTFYLGGGGGQNHGEHKSGITIRLNVLQN